MVHHHTEVQDLLSVTANIALKFVKETFVVVELNQLGPYVVMNINGLDGFGFHINVPDLQSEIIPRYNVSPIRTELYIIDRGKDFSEKRLAFRVLFIIKLYRGMNIALNRDQCIQPTFRMIVTESRHAHVIQFDGSLATTVHE